MTNIVETLQKLINHERSAREIGNLAEAEAFAAKIQTILTQHKLSMSEVEFEAQDSDNPIGDESAQFPGKAIPTWQVYLSQSIARNFFCHVLGQPGANCVTFIGRDSDRKVAVEMYCYLSNLAIKFSGQDADAYINGPAVQRVVNHVKATTTATSSEIKKEIVRLRKNYKSSFLLGFGVAILKRLDATLSDLNATVSAHAAGLILRDTAAVEEFARSRFEVAGKQVRKPRVGHSAGFAKGVERGNATALRNSAALGAGN